MRVGLSLCILSTTLACTSGNKSSTGRTEREKDSVIANSKVPNAQAVKKSMEVADSTSARVKLQDSIARSEGE